MDVHGEENSCNYFVKTTPVNLNISVMPSFRMSCMFLYEIHTYYGKGEFGKKKN